MLLRRRGSKKDHGWKKIFEKDSPKIDWDKTLKSVKISVRNVRDTTGSTYDYDVSLSIDDIQKIIESLAEKGITDCQSEISQKFSTQLDKFLKLMMCCVGIVPQDSGDATKTA
jgi:hypothetical protein